MCGGVFFFFFVFLGWGGGGGGGSLHLRIFHSYGDVTITGKGLLILTFARHSWPLRSEGSLTCHTYCDTGQPFIMIISEDPWHSHLLPSVWQWRCHYLSLTTWASPDQESNSDLLYARQTLYHNTTAAVW